MKNVSINEIYEILDVPEKTPCENCSVCLRLRMMELGLLSGEKIRIKGHRLGLWIIDILNENNTTQSTLVLRENEFERICLK